jgi:SAM-dependent methyltransferase
VGFLRVDQKKPSLQLGDNAPGEAVHFLLRPAAPGTLDDVGIQEWRGNMSGYALDNSWERAKRRLNLLENYLDPMTKRRFKGLGLGEGSHCLEIGAGGGSVAVWLSEEVGPTGRVVATDINVTLLQDLSRPNLQAWQHDILTEALPEAEFDFVHTRWLLHHLPDPEIAIGRMIAALRPGGWLLLEEVDFFPVHASSSPEYQDFMIALTGAVVQASGRDCFWARALPGLVAKSGLAEIGSEGDFSVFRGGSPTAEFFLLTAEQMRDRMLESKVLTLDQLEHALSLLASPDFWAFGGGGIAVWGQRTH